MHTLQPAASPLKVDVSSADLKLPVQQITVYLRGKVLSIREIFTFIANETFLKTQDKKF